MKKILIGGLLLSFAMISAHAADAVAPKKEDAQPNASAPAQDNAAQKYMGDRETDCAANANYERGHNPKQLVLQGTNTKTESNPSGSVAK